ncbi:DUF4397 domain-containing protein [Mucilaginibacter panaciglaebae]|uniref:DUF4397 domain-containing protein n=1 Tax=Mucilaginibacter panaciglaebae TaxID=502331 RepID=A0ABP7WEX5_9SPHI
MKHFKRLQHILFAGLVLITAASCTKTHEEPAPIISGLAFIAASPDAPGVTLFVDQNRVNYDSVRYSAQSDYLNAYSGNRQVSAYQGLTKKVSADITLKQGKFYSLFLTGRWQNAEFVLLEDSLAKPETGKANIRFLNMSVGAPSLDLGLDNGTTLVSGRNYKQNSGFIAVDGNKAYKFVIREHGATQAKATLTAATLKAGHIYTIWAKGIYTASDTTTGPGGKIMENY